MKQIRISLLLAALIFTVAALRQGTKSAAAASAPHAQQSPQPPAARLVDLKASDGTFLKASYFASAKPGPGVLLLHQSNRTRKAWDDLAGQLAATGINTLTLDIRGFGESGGKPDKRLTDARDIDTAFQYLVSQPGVKRDVIGGGGAGVLGVDRSVNVARQRSAQVKSLVLLSGERPSETAWNSCGRGHNCPDCSSWPTTTNTLPSWRRWNRSTSPPAIQARSSSTTPQRKRRPGCGMNLSMSGESPPMAAMEPTCLEFIRSCPA